MRTDYFDVTAKVTANHSRRSGFWSPAARRLQKGQQTRASLSALDLMSLARKFEVRALRNERNRQAMGPTASPGDGCRGAQGSASGPAPCRCPPRFRYTYLRRAHQICAVENLCTGSGIALVAGCRAQRWPTGRALRRSGFFGNRGRCWQPGLGRCALEDVQLG